MHVARVVDENEGLQTICSCRLARWLGRARWLDISILEQAIADFESRGPWKLS